MIIGLLGSHPEVAGNFTQRVINNIWASSLVVILNYFSFEFWWPIVFKKREYLIYNIILGLVSLFFLFIIYTMGLFIWRGFGIALHIYAPLTIYKDFSHLAESLCAFAAGSMIFTGIARHIYLYSKLKRSEQRLRIEKQDAELNYLRSQTNPHFLFNTLNNIYSLSRSKSDRAPESIMRLSKILRFMLYETSGDFISIDQEIRIINDYIELEKLRYDESLRVNFNYDVEDMKQSIPPLLLVPLVENAFKHGVSETRGEPFIDIHLSLRNRKLSMVIKNSFESVIEGPVKENIGLSNLRRQLELLYTDYSLTAQPGKGIFTSTLNIDLSSHA